MSTNISNPGAGPLNFVMENPSKVTQGQRKRDRRITACDQCRDKRIKCDLLPGRKDLCAACQKADDVCDFRDRKQYQKRQREKLGLAPLMNVGPMLTQPSPYGNPTPDPRMHYVQDGRRKERERVQLAGAPYPMRGAGSRTRDFTDATAFAPGRPSFPSIQTTHLGRPHASEPSASGRYTATTLTPNPASPRGYGRGPSGSVSPTATAHPMMFPMNDLNHFLPSIDPTSMDSDRGFLSAVSPNSYTQHARPYDLPLPTQSQFSPQRPYASHVQPTCGPAPPPSIAETPLFDPVRPHYPSPQFMYHFLDRLAELGTEWQGLHGADVRNRFAADTLNPVLANAIAGFAARYAGADFSGALGLGSSAAGNGNGRMSSTRARHHAGEEYWMKSQVLLGGMEQGVRADMEMIYACVFMSWAAYGSSRAFEFYKYGNMAIDMVQQLDNKEHYPDLLRLSPSERRRLGLTWFTVARLDSAMSWTNGEPMRMKGEHSVWATALGSGASEAFEPLGHISYINRQMLIIRSRLQYMLSAEYRGAQQGEEFQTELIAIQQSLMELTQSLPLSIRFTTENFRAFKAAGSATVFVQLHLGINSFVIMANCPSIFRRFKHRVQEKLDVACYFAKTIVEVIKIGQLEDFKSVSAIPCLDLLIGAAAWTLLKDCRANPKPARLGDFNRRGFDEGLLQDCIEVLNPTAGMWQNLETIRTALVVREPFQYIPPVDACHLGPPNTSDENALIPYDFQAAAGVQNQPPPFLHSLLIPPHGLPPNAAPALPNLHDQQYLPDPGQPQMFHATLSGMSEPGTSSYMMPYAQAGPSTIGGAYIEEVDASPVDAYASHHSTQVSAPLSNDYYTQSQHGRMPASGPTQSTSQFYSPPSAISSVHAHSTLPLSLPAEPTTSQMWYPPGQGPSTYNTGQHSITQYNHTPASSQRYALDGRQPSVQDHSLQDRSGMSTNSGAYTTYLVPPFAHQNALPVSAHPNSSLAPDTRFGGYHNQQITYGANSPINGHHSSQDAGGHGMPTEYSSSSSQGYSASS